LLIGVRPGGLPLDYHVVGSILVTSGGETSLGRAGTRSVRLAWGAQGCHCHWMGPVNVF
jgi:hypothetical protein